MYMKLCICDFHVRLSVDTILSRATLTKPFSDQNLLYDNALVGGIITFSDNSFQLRGVELQGCVGILPKFRIVGEFCLWNALPVALLLTQGDLTLCYLVQQQIGATLLICKDALLGTSEIDVVKKNS